MLSKHCFLVRSRNTVSKVLQRSHLNTVYPQGKQSCLDWFSYDFSQPHLWYKVRYIM